MPKLFFAFLLVFVCSHTIAHPPSGTVVHQVVKGETLYAIAKKYHVTVDVIEKANRITSGTKLKLGQKLTIPVSTSIAKTESPNPSSSQSGISPSPPKQTKPLHAPPVAVAKTESPTPSPSQSGISPSAPKQPKSERTPPASVGDGSIHMVAKGETVYALARTFGVSVRDIKNANHLGVDMKLSLGQKLIIPSRNPDAMYGAAKVSKKEEKTPDHPFAPDEDHSVRHKSQTTISEAKKSTEQGKEYQSAAPEVIKKEPVKQEVSEPLHVVEDRANLVPVRTYVPDKPLSAKKAVPVVNTENLSPSDYASAFSSYPESGRKKVLYRGIGGFMKSENPGNQYLALYNYADLGSILKVTNLMSKQTIYVRVIGKVAASDAQNEIILKVSSQAATQLKVNEDRFLVEVTGYNAQ